MNRFIKIVFYILKYINMLTLELPNCIQFLFRGCQCTFSFRKILIDPSKFPNYFFPTKILARQCCRNPNLLLRFHDLQMDYQFFQNIYHQSYLNLDKNITIFQMHLQLIYHNLLVLQHKFLLSSLLHRLLIHIKRHTIYNAI